MRAAVAGRGETVVAVGHQPDCSEIVLELTGRTHALRARRGRRGRALSAVAVSGLRKRYGEHEALRGIDFTIEAGEVFGLLGPNGAGKTTTVEILEGYRDRDGGTVEVLGVDPQRATAPGASASASCSSPPRCTRR